MKNPGWHLSSEDARLTHPHAFKSASTRGRLYPENADGLRNDFERDGHRILHAKPFRRMRNKTQVFFSPENDHIATRMDHSLYVATISRTISRNLGLNDDLAYAAALGHDLGHSPFGHSGERVLARLLAQYQSDPRAPAYTHEAQSLRVVDALSSMPGQPYAGLNLTFEVRDAIRCHCGESTERTLRPRDACDPRDPSGLVGRANAPITLEGCVIRMADRIAYLGRDYEDAQVALGDKLPVLPDAIAQVLGRDNREIINRLVVDLIEENRREPAVIGFSERVHEAAMAMRSFNYQHIYTSPTVEEQRAKTDKILVRIFDELYEHLSARPRERWSEGEPGWPMHLRALARFMGGARYASAPDVAQVVADYICLMTDGFAFKIVKSVVFPEPIV